MDKKQPSVKFVTILISTEHIKQGKFHNNVFILIEAVFSWNFATFTTHPACPTVKWFT